MKLRWLLPAVLLVAQAAERDPALVLQRAAIKVRVRAAALPNYTCVETVTRDYYRPRTVVQAPSCAGAIAGLAGGRGPDMRFTMTDRLRLDVAMTERGEIYSWAGASKFEDSDVGALVHRGPIGSGSFGAVLAILFAQDAGKFHFERMAGSLMEYSYLVPPEDSRYKVRTSDSWVNTAYSGTVQLDPETAEVVRVTLQTAELPPSTGSCQTTTTMEFAPVRIGDSEFPLPKRGEQRFIGAIGEEVENTTAFGSCREYRGESTIRFGADAAAETVERDGSAAGVAEVPAGLSFSFELRTPIAADTAAGGDAFAGRLAGPLRDRLGRVLAPAHAVVEGRLLRVENRHTAPPGSVLVLRLRTVQIGGVKVPLVADRVVRVAKGERVEPPFSWESHAGLFRLAGEHGVMKAGTRSEWVTR